MGGCGCSRVISCARLLSAKLKVMAVVEVGRAGGALATYSLHGKIEFLELCLPVACLGEIESKSSCTAHGICMKP